MHRSEGVDDITTTPATPRTATLDRTLPHETSSRRTRIHRAEWRWWPYLLLLGSFFYIDISAQLYPVELVLAAVALNSFFDPDRRRLPSWVHVTLFAWLIATATGDLWLQVDAEDRVKGIARVMFLWLDIIGIWSLANRGRWNDVGLWTSLAISQVIGYLLLPNIYAAGEPWKFGFGLAVTIITVVIVNGRKRHVQAVAIIALSGAHFALGYRSMSLICLASALVIIIAARSRQRERKGRPASIARPIATLVVALVAALGLVHYYDQLSLRGDLGNDLQTKAQYQADGRFGSLASGRTEVLLSAQSISAHPILGSGSYSPIPREVVLKTAETYEKFGYASVSRAISANRQAVYHSQLLGTWAENGILGAAFWLALIICLGRVLFRVIRGKGQVGSLATFAAVFGLWNAAFSPFGADFRIIVALTLTTALLAVAGRSDQFPDNAPIERNSPAR